MRKCPYCAEDIQDQAIVCRFCNRDLKTGAHPSTPQPQTINPGIAAVLSLVIPGAGQMYRGELGAGILWLLFVVLGYFLFIIPGLVLHVFCVVNAAAKPTQEVVGAQGGARPPVAQGPPGALSIPERRARQVLRKVAIAWVGLAVLVVLGVWVARVVQVREKARLEAVRRENYKNDETKTTTPAASAEEPLRVDKERPLTMAEANRIKSYDETNAQARLVKACATAHNIFAQVNGTATFLRYLPALNWPSWKVTVGREKNAECVIIDNGTGDPYEWKVR